MGNVKEVVNRQKASWFFQEKLICHVRKKPEGFVNGWFRSNIIDELYYEFEDQRWPGQEKKLWLSEIFDIDDYEVEG